MTFLLCLCFAALMTYVGRTVIKRYAGVLYLLAAVLALFASCGTAFGLSSYLPGFAEAVFFRPLVRGSFASALFVLVMIAGAFPAGHPAGQLLRSVRGELSILASILTLGHNAAAGQTYFLLLFSDPASLSLPQLLASVCSLVMLALMLPLFITSFPSIRKKMSGRHWKQLQKLAYPFYALMYIHVFLLYAPAAGNGNLAMLGNLAVFTVIFAGYAACRTAKALRLRYSLPCAAALVCSVLIVGCCFPRDGFSRPEEEQIFGDLSEETGIPSSGIYQNGTFRGKGRGYAGPVYVEVTIADDVITQITVTEHREDAPYWERALVTIDRILEQQQTKVDSVAGATKSCKGIQKAVRDALKKAQNK